MPRYISRHGNFVLTVTTWLITLPLAHAHRVIMAEIILPCPIISFSLMEDDGMIRCGGRLSSNELLTKVTFLPDSAWAMWGKKISDHNEMWQVQFLISLGTYSSYHHLPLMVHCCKELLKHQRNNDNNIIIMGTKTNQWRDIITLICN